MKVGVLVNQIAVVVSCYWDQRRAASPRRVSIGRSASWISLPQGTGPESHRLTRWRSNKT